MGNLALLPQQPASTSYDTVLLASAARTGTNLTAILDASGFSAAIFYLTVAAAGTGNLSLWMEVFDPTGASSWFYTNWLALATGAGPNLAVCDTFSVEPHFYGNAKVRGLRVPNTIRMQVIPSDGSSWTYSLSMTAIR